MRPFGWVLVVVLIGTASRGADEEAAQLRRLAGRLASPDFHVRETASHELDRLGDASLPLLREAMTTGDAETRRRAAELIERIGRRQSTARLLAPTYVNLNYDHSPLGAALVDLSQRIGVPISLHGDMASLDGRTVSLVSEKATTWQAIQLFCNCAGLHEWDGISSGLPAPVNLPSDGPQAGDGMIVLGQMQVRRGQVSALTANMPATKIALIDKAAPVLPTHHAGAVRIRAMPPGTAFPAEAGKDHLLVLHISAEPRLHVDGATDLRIDRAVDERGRERICKPTWADPPDSTNDWPRGARIPRQLIARKHGPVAIRFPHEVDAPERLRELAGVVTIQAFAAQPAVEMAWPAHGVRQTAHGGGVTLSAISFADRHEVGLTAEVQLPYGTRLEQPVAGLIGFAGRGGFGRNLIGFTNEPESAAISGSDYQGLSIEDAAGQRFPATTGASEIAGLFADHYTVHVTATFRAPAKGTGPARVRFAICRPMMAEVPFVLRDVPLQ